MNVALLSRWHVHADDYAREVKENSNLSIGLVWDQEPERGKKWAEELGVPFEADLQTVLNHPTIEAVIVNTPTNLHKEVILAAIQAKKHVFTEKVLAFTVEDCLDIYEAVQANEVHLMVSLPRLTEPPYVYAEKVLNEGFLGQLTSIRCRMAHNGAVVPEGKESGWLPERFFNKGQCGGGALIDLGAHPIYLTNRLAGPVRSIQAHLQETHELGVDDNAVVIVEYQSGTLGVIETGFLSSGSPFQLELYGTQGTLLIEDQQVRLKSSLLETNDWVIPSEELASLPSPMTQWVAAMQTGTEPSIKKEDVINLTKINEAAAKSNSEKRRIEL